MTEAEGIVRRYLAAMEARDLDAARACLARGAVLAFPGAAPMSEPAEVAAWAAPRYRRVTKTHAGMDACDGVLYLRGTLAGEWPDGTAFEGIRFVDRFEVTGGRIVRQDVWNDLAEARP